MTPSPVPREFFVQPTHMLARNLLGKVLMLESAGGRIVEVEAYQGPTDRGAHSFGGRRTARTEVMFGEPGHAYIYRIYGRYDCVNVVSAAAGRPEAILVRALEPLAASVDEFVRRRNCPPGTHSARIPILTNGPGRLTQALGIDRSWNGHPLWQEPFYIADDGVVVPASDLRQGPRVGIAYAGMAAEFPWRYWIAGNPFVSRP